MKRYRVRLRPRVQQKRRGLFSSVAAVLFLTALAVFAGRGVTSAVRSRVAGRLQSPFSGLTRVDALEFEGASDALAGSLREATGWRSGDAWGLGRPAKVRESLLERFSCLKGLDYSRSWAGRRVRFQVSMRRPLARASSGGASAGLLWEGGVVFDPPEGIASAEGLPVLDIGGKPSKAELDGLAGFIETAAAPEAMPAALRGMVYEPGDGWAFELADGTRLLWGRLGWTEEKLARLKQVLADARPRFGGAMTADLRHFGDGKIFVRVR